LILPFFGERYGRFAEVGLVGQAVGGYFLFENSPVSLVLIGITLVLAVLYNRFVLIPIMRTQRSHNEYDESNEVVGLRGRVVKALDPVGTVYVNKELWRARSSEVLLPDTPVMIVGQDGLELVVEKAKNEDAPNYHHQSNGASV
jgi:membrane-bound ClpP family serine protease